MFKVLVHVCQEARCKPLIHVIQTSNRSLIFTQELAFLRNEGGFPFRKPLGPIFVALANFIEALNHTLVQGASTFPTKVSGFIRPWRSPVALLGQDVDRFRYFESHSSPVGGGTCSWIAIFTSCNQAAFLFPVPLSSHSFLQNPLASSMFSNIRESSRARFLGSLYLGRSFSGPLFNISLKFANTLPGTMFVMSLIRTNYIPEWRIRAHAQSVLAAGQKHHNSSPLANACNMVTNKDLKR